MKKKSTIIILICLAILCASTIIYIATRNNSTPQNTIQETTTVNGKVVAKIIMNDDSYSPNEVTLKVGEAITFTNKSSANRWPASNIHPTHELYPEFDPKRELKPGESWTFTFQNKGKWRMHDHLAPYIKGTISVE